MKQKKPWAVVCCMIILLAAVGCGAFFLGRSTEDKRHQEERQFDIQLHRSDLEGLGEIKEPIYVTGHKSPDSDTVGCAIAYAALLQKLGYDAVPAVLGPVSHETEYILEAAGLEVPALLEDASGLTMVLVDHSMYTQSADGLEDADIISIIDHHGDGSVTTGNQLIYDSRPFGSAATIVWIRYRDYGLEPDRQTALVMMGAVLSDTSNLLSGNTTFADREALKALSEIAGISDTDAFYREMFKASLSYEGMSDEEIFFSDYKEFESGGKKYSIGCVNAYDEETALALAERMKAVIPSTMSSTGMDMAFAQISIFHDDISVTYLVPSDEAAAEVLDAAFGDTAVFDGKFYRLEPGVSRRKVLVPAISGVLESYPGE